MSNRTYFMRLVVTLLLAVLAVAGTTVALAGPLAVPVEAPASQATGGWAEYLLHSGAVSITADATGTGRVIADYGVVDCYQIVDIGSAQRVTTTMAHSPDNSNWVDGMVFPGRQADGVDYLTFPVTGTYNRASVDIMTAATGVTVTVRCTAKDKSN